MGGVNVWWPGLWVLRLSMLMTSTRFTSLSGYHEEKSSFGVMKKGIYKPSSDFNFDFVDEVLCANPYNSGYLVTVTYERSHACDNTESTRYFKCFRVLCINLVIGQFIQQIYTAHYYVYAPLKSLPLPQKPV